MEIHKRSQSSSFKAQALEKKHRDLHNAAVFVYGFFWIISWLTFPSIIRVPHNLL